MTDALPFALSTMYFQRWLDQDDLAPFFDAARGMGFDRFELGHFLTPAAVGSIVPRAQAIETVHHPCPLEDAGQRRDRLTATDPEARARAAEAVRRTIDTAARLGAGAVVLHLGRVADDAAGTIRRLRFELDGRYRAGQAGGDRYARVRDRLRDEVAAREAEHLDRAIEALAPVLAHARRQGVTIGLETGLHAHELPRPGGMRRLLDALAGTCVAAWLDTGHVGVQANLGLDGFDDWFAAVDGRWLGAHLHDVVGLRDHLVPGMGHLDLAAIVRRLPPSSLLTCELDWYFEPDELAAGTRALARQIGG